VTSSPTITNTSEKILAIQFKYFGDAVLLTPALRVLREHFPNAELHLLVPEETAPLFQPLPWLNRVWPMPRQRGRARFSQSWPIIRTLRRERFDRSVDFASNDRGAILSRLIGARHRLGWGEPGGFWGRRFCYTERVAPETKLQHESVRLRSFCPAGKFRRRFRLKLKSAPIRRWPMPPKKFFLRNARSFAMSPPASRRRNGRWRIGQSYTACSPRPDSTSSSPRRRANANRR